MALFGRIDMATNNIGNVDRAVAAYGKMCQQRQHSGFDKAGHLFRRASSSVE